MTTRHGGVSAPPFDTMNLREGIGDDDQAVMTNHRLLREAMGVSPVWLKQVHGVRVETLDGSQDHRPEADASVSRLRGVACAVQVADCLPVLFAAPAAVGAAHAGWRGLAGGVLEATLAAVCRLSKCRAQDVQAWLGPCIGPQRFEVGPDVLQAFGAALHVHDVQRFVPHVPGKWFANLPQLARDRLAAAGVLQVTGGRWCTVNDASRFFSFRRDRVTGRMAGMVWLR